MMNLIGETKPWNVDMRMYPDSILWYDYRDELQALRPELFE
jgi:hypothetical protein